MTTPPVRVERRVGQRFPFLLPISIRQVLSGSEHLGFTQDLSSRGVFFYTDALLEEGAELELTLNMPSQITLGESMRVKCRARVLRVVRPAESPLAAGASFEARAETKIGVAARLHSYEYLPEAVEGTAAFERVAVLHNHHDESLGPQPSISSQPVED